MFSQKKLTGTQSHSGTKESAEVLLMMSDEIMVEIIKLVRPEIILGSLAFVCKRFLEVSQSNVLWQFKQDQHFSLTKVVQVPNQSVLTVFQSNYLSAYKNGEEYLFSCVKEGDVGALKSSKIKLDHFFETEDQTGKSLFDWAILRKQQSVLDYVYELARDRLIREDAQTVDVEKVDHYGRTLLYWAAQTNQVEMIIPLIEAGAVVNQAKSNGQTPLLIAAENGHLEVVKVLLDKGAKIDQANNNGETPLFIAAQKGRHEVVKVLLDKGAQVNQAENDGGTPLCIAAENGRLEVVKVLLDKGAKVDQADNYGVTPLLMAAENGHLEVVKVLLEKDANVNQATTDDGTTPLYIAAQNGHLEVVKMLLEKGARIGEANVNLLEVAITNPILELKPANTLKEGVVFIDPANVSQLSQQQFNTFIMLALEKAHQFLTQIRQDLKKASAIRNLIDLIDTDIHKSFADHVENWKSQVSTQDKTMTNQMIISDHENPASKGVKIMAFPVTSFIGFFSESTAKTLKNKTKTDTEIFIEDLVNHSKLWSEFANVSENTSSSSSPSASSGLNNHGGQ